ncbi:MAG TPA: (2Fe-2S) ferredoxin domain-containing protein [Candidatus Izemoplasmatales bacterium]|nr:(2Fe-2S) ferredoxin domain-containing protein [Candidatus Izemoplasmatales bacterium]
MVVKVCIGSSCHLKGSREVVESFQALLEAHHLEEKVKFVGQFCMGQCQKGVNVTIDKQTISVTPTTVESIFERYVLKQVNHE